LVSAGPARAEFVADSSVSIAGSPATSGPGYLTGTVAVDNISTTQAVIQITLTNTSPVANGGFITGFAFNDPNSSSKGNISTVSGFTQSYAPPGAPPPNTMQLIGGPSYNNSISGASFGSFDLGAAVGGNLLGGGAPQPGIEVGQTGTFEFTVTGSHLNNLTAQGIMSALSHHPKGGGPAALLVRFRGFKDGDSDKVVAGVVKPPPPPPPPPPGVIPAPPSAVLAGLALGTCLLGRLTRRRSGTPQG
jgi:hypothetical protein